MKQTNRGTSSHWENPGGRPSENTEISAPLGALKNGRLVFASGASRLSLSVGGRMPELYRALFTGPVPRIWLHENTLTIHGYHTSPVDRRDAGQGPWAQISLNDSIPWEIEFHSQVSELRGDLRGLQLRSLDILGGASHIDLALSKPPETTFIYISESLNDSVIRRPGDVGVRIRVSGGLRNLTLDGQRFGAADGEIILESANFGNATNRYEVCIAGGAQHVKIEAESPTTSHPLGDVGSHQSR